MVGPWLIVNDFYIQKCQNFLLILGVTLPEAQMLASEERAMHGLNIAGNVSRLLLITGVPVQDIVLHLRKIAETLQESERGVADVNVEVMFLESCARVLKNCA